MEVKEHEKWSCGKNDECRNYGYECVDVMARIQSVYMQNVARSEMQDAWVKMPEIDECEEVVKL